MAFFFVNFFFSSLEFFSTNGYNYVTSAAFLVRILEEFVDFVVVVVDPFIFVFC